MDGYFDTGVLLGQHRWLTAAPLAVLIVAVSSLRKLPLTKFYALTRDSGFISEGLLSW